MVRSSPTFLSSVDGNGCKSRSCSRSDSNGWCNCLLRSIVLPTGERLAPNNLRRCHSMFQRIALPSLAARSCSELLNTLHSRSHRRLFPLLGTLGKTRSGDPLLQGTASCFVLPWHDVLWSPWSPWPSQCDSGRTGKRVTIQQRRGSDYKFPQSGCLCSFSFPGHRRHTEMCRSAAPGQCRAA